MWPPVPSQAGDRPREEAGLGFGPRDPLASHLAADASLPGLIYPHDTALLSSFQVSNSNSLIVLKKAVIKLPFYLNPS